MVGGHEIILETMRRQESGAHPRRKMNHVNYVEVRISAPVRTTDLTVNEDVPDHPFVMSVLATGRLVRNGVIDIDIDMDMDIVRGRRPGTMNAVQELQSGVMGICQLIQGRRTGVMHIGKEVQDAVTGIVQEFQNLVMHIGPGQAILMMIIDAQGHLNQQLKIHIMLGKDDTMTSS